MKTVATLAAALLAATALASPALADDGRQLLLNIDFAPRDVTQVEVGDFHFTPGQLAPVHTHAAPAIGYVSKGTILYQVEGQPMQVLKAGDAFYEPVGPRILHFDNASATEEAIFTDFNLEQTGEPFIVFPKPPTEKIDRRTFPTAPIGVSGATKAVAYADRLTRAKPYSQALTEPVVGYVAQGSVAVQVGDAAPQPVGLGKSFYAPAGRPLRVSTKGASAEIVTFAFGS